MALLDNEQGGLLSGAMNPAAQGLLAAGLGLLAGARSGNPAGALGAGGLAGLQAFQQAQAAGDMQAYRQAQAQKLQQEAKKNEVVLGLLSRLGGGQAQGGQTPVDVHSAGPLLAGATPAASPGLLGGAASAGQSAASSGGFNLSLPEVTALKMAGVDLTDLYKISREGFKREPGAAYVLPDGTTNYGPPKLPEGMELGVGPDGRVVARLVAGYNDANAAAKAAEAAAVAQAQGRYSTTTIPTGNGGSQTVLTSDLPSVLGGQGQPQQGTAPEAAPQGDAPGYTPPQAVLDARNQFGEMKAMADQMLSNISTLRNHKGFESNYGFAGMIPNRLGGDAADAKALTNQLISQGWLQMRDKLKGTGAITDYESEKAQQAWSALNDTRISPKMAREQLDVIEKVVRDGLARAEAKAFGKKPAEGKSPAAGGIPADFSDGNFSSLWGG